MVTHFVEQATKYDGQQLKSHWAYRTFGLEGDSIVAFIGECEVAGEALVDLEDARAGEKILARSMLHFIVEHFDPELERAILRQRLLVALVAEALRERGAGEFIRRGDDLYHGDRKLTVSVATISPVSALIHLGINVDPEGATVPAVGLRELGVDATSFAKEVMRNYQTEMASVQRARTKVRPVP